MTHVLYRAYAKGGVLLYIGITSNESNRFAVHACRTPWWHQVDRVQVEPEQYKDREAAEVAERAAIRAEYPYYNIEHKLPGCPTCYSPSPACHPREGITVNSEPFAICMDPFHHPGNEEVARVAERAELRRVVPAAEREALEKWSAFWEDLLHNTEPRTA
jgi:hypothetical protein